ncbi:hypothetical protein [Rossellomorea sp. NRS-1567]
MFRGFFLFLFNEGRTSSEVVITDIFIKLMMKKVFVRISDLSVDKVS